MQTQEHWDNFKASHSVGTYLWLKENDGKAISLEDFIIEHDDTCMSKKRTARACAKDLYKYLTKWDWIKNADSQ